MDQGDAGQHDLPCNAAGEFRQRHDCCLRCVELLLFKTSLGNELGRPLADVRIGDGKRTEPAQSFLGFLLRQKELLDTHPELAFVSVWTEFCGPAQEYIFTEKGTGEALSPRLREGRGIASIRSRPWKIGRRPPAARAGGAGNALATW